MPERELALDDSPYNAHSWWDDIRLCDRCHNRYPRGASVNPEPPHDSESRIWIRWCAACKRSAPTRTYAFRRTEWPEPVGRHA